MNTVKKTLALALAAGVLASAVPAAAKDGDDKGDKKDHAVAAPELASKGAPIALALIAGGVAVVVSRRKRAS
jgi:hypothetical protein